MMLNEFVVLGNGFVVDWHNNMQPVLFGCLSTLMVRKMSPTMIVQMEQNDRPEMPNADNMYKKHRQTDELLNECTEFGVIKKRMAADRVICLLAWIIYMYTVGLADGFLLLVQTALPMFAAALR